MKTIVNISLCGPYSDGFSYQENLLPKYQKRLGYRVVLIAPVWRWGHSGVLEKTDPSCYVDENGVEIIRIETDGERSVDYRFKRYPRLESTLEGVRPDIVFLHGCQFLDAGIVANYVKQNPSTELFVDSHVDFSNSARTPLSRYVLHGMLWKAMAKRLEPYAKRFWGVTPGRVDFLKRMYGLPAEKCELLVMGADDDEVKRAERPCVRKMIRDRLSFSDDDFLVVTGGKIDSAKTQTFLLMDAVRAMGGKTRLLVFGPVDPGLQDEFNSRLSSDCIAYIPWANASESYDYFAAADVVCFPGRHSVYWEQAVAMGKPLVVKRWPGLEHVDICGNALFLNEDSVTEVRAALESIKDGSAAGGAIVEKARVAAREFVYSDIARKSIDVEGLDG